MTLNRRAVLTALISIPFTRSVNAQNVPEMTVYKDPSCGCCGAWVRHIKSAGFHVRVIEMVSMDAVKKQYGVPESLLSCHTAEIDGFVIEGHVPAAEVARLLKERPIGKGLAVSGMPTNSPGMEVRGAPDEQYEVILFSGSEQPRTFATYRGATRVS